MLDLILINWITLLIDNFNICIKKCVIYWLNIRAILIHFILFDSNQTLFLKIKHTNFIMKNPLFINSDMLAWWMLI